MMQLLSLGTYCNRALFGRSSCFVLCCKSLFGEAKTKTRPKEDADDDSAKSRSNSKVESNNKTEIIGPRKLKSTESKKISFSKVGANRATAVKKFVGKTGDEFQETFRKYGAEEMALLTDSEGSLELLEAVLKCPLSVNDWGKVARGDRALLRKLSDTINTENELYVTKILQDTAPPLNQIMLHKWKKKKIAEMGQDGFKTYMKTIINEGISFHKSIECYLGRLPVGIEDTGQWKSIFPFLEKVGDMHGLERKISHPLLSYSGRIDCIAKHGENLCVLDWKLSSSKKETLKKCYDDPYQVAAYVGAFNISNDPSLQVSNAVIVKAYRDGTPADVHFMNEVVLDFYWEGWLRRLARHHVRVYNSLKGGSDTSDVGSSVMMS